MSVVQAECPACNATGIYRGFAEPAWVGVVCLKCDGSGCVDVHYAPFTGRKERRDVREVRRSQGALLPLGVGPTGRTISYDEFKRGRKP